MKIEKFLKWIQNKLLNYPDIDFKTVKMFVDKFSIMLSELEHQRNYLLINTIREFTLKQITIDSFVLNSKIEILDNELNNLKGDDKDNEPI